LAYTFRGGIRPDDHKYTANCPIEKISPPDHVSISLTQHVGVMCRPCVKVGDRVCVGQLIGDIPGGLGCPVHSSVSGEVTGVEEVTTDHGGVSYNIIIKNDYMNTLSESVRPFGKKLSEATFEEIVSVIRNAGITGMGGTAFPTYAKLSHAKGKVNKLIINCCEGEPFVTATKRMILENARGVIGGAKILMMALGVRNGIAVVEKDRKKEIRAIQNELSAGDIFKIAKVSSKYPSGSEKHIYYALTKEEIPSGESPVDFGAVVFNAETCVAVYDAFTRGLPLVNRVITVDGDCISTPKNILVPIGTRASYIIDQCGGLSASPKKIIFGGPMRGHAQWDPNTPVTKNTSAVLVFSDYFDRESKLEAVCIRCARCVKACPMKLMPLEIAAMTAKGKIEKAEALGAVDCIECGACTHVCPGGMPCTQLISRAKSEILMKRRSTASDK